MFSSTKNKNPACVFSNGSGSLTAHCRKPSLESNNIQSRRCYLQEMNIPILRKRKKKKPTSDSSTKNDINIHPTWSRFQNRTSYWSLTNLSTDSAASRRPLVADLPVTDSHSPLCPRCCLRKVARAVVTSSTKLFTQQSRRPRAEWKVSDLLTRTAAVYSSEERTDLQRRV